MSHQCAMKFTKSRARITVTSHKRFLVMEVLFITCLHKIAIGSVLREYFYGSDCDKSIQMKASP